VCRGGIVCLSTCVCHGGIVCIYVRVCHGEIVCVYEHVCVPWGDHTTGLQCVKL